MPQIIGATVAVLLFGAILMGAFNTGERNREESYLRKIHIACLEGGGVWDDQSKACARP